jgi:hypothetical protein
VLLALAAVIILALGSVLVRRHSKNVAEEMQLESYRQALAAQPGIVVTSSSREGGRYRLAGLRDPASTEPAKVVAALGRDQPELVFEPFYSLHPRVTEARFRRALTPPDTVTVAVTDGTLKLSGAAPLEWIDRALTQARTLPGVERVESTLLDTSARDLASAARGLEALDVAFATGSAELDPLARDSIARALELVTEIDRLSAGLSRRTCITIVGDADTSGASATNRRLARARARAVAAAVRPPSALRATELEERVRGADDAFPPSRSAHFRVRTDTSGEGCREGDRW